MTDMRGVQASMEVTEEASRKMPRNTFVFFKATCTQPAFYSVGKAMRQMLVKALQKGAGKGHDVHVQCIDSEIGTQGYNEQVWL